MSARPVRRKALSELRQALKHGPHMAWSTNCENDTVRLWLNSWVVPRLRQLVPELRDLPDVTPYPSSDTDTYGA